MSRTAKPKICEDCSKEVFRKDMIGTTCIPCWDTRQFKFRESHLLNVLKWSKESGSELYTMYHVRDGSDSCGNCKSMNGFVEPVTETMKEFKITRTECKFGSCTIHLQYMSKRKYYRDILDKPLP